MSRWQKVADKRGGEWSVTKDCPFKGEDPLAKLRASVDRGEYLMAQRRTGPFAFDLIITRPRGVVTHVPQKPKNW
jgi:hypothetical protein